MLFMAFRGPIAFAFTLLGASIGVAAIGGGCSEKFPEEFRAAQPVPDASVPIGIEARPYNPECIAKKKVSTQNTLIGFQAVTQAKFTQPVEVVLHDNKLYVLELGGRISIVNDDGMTTREVVTVPANRLVYGGESGLLGLAFHPNFATNGFVYLYFTAQNNTALGDTGYSQNQIIRLHSNDNGLTFDFASEKRILSISDPYGNHNGGTIAFGADGFLYLGTGDGGSGGDPENRAQDKNELLGKMLRIDVDSADPYGIPPTNPYATAGGRKEIYALGLRNPYRWRFDTVTNALWVGDVGQGAKEEIDKITLGGNYGWRIREGKQCYPATVLCDPTGLIDPVVDHPRNEATSITGGVVYRGAGVPSLTGQYVYGDFGQGTYFAIPIDQQAPSPLRLDEGVERKTNPSAFALDKNGEILVLDFGAGELLRIVPGGKAVAEMPEFLTETGCVNRNDATKVAEGLFPYAVNVEQWADGATAERNISIPEVGVFRVSPEGRLALPIGSVVMKTLSAEGRKVETQLLLHRPDDTWDAYAYVWLENQANALLAKGATRVKLPSGREHIVADRSQCISCHALDVIPTIGLEAAQLDRDDVDYGNGKLGNPLATLEKLKIIEEPVPRDTYKRLPRAGGFETAERRARGYLHANCAFCHRGGEKLIDLRFSTPLRSTQACDVAGKLKVGGRAIIQPRQPDESQLFNSMKTTGEGRMPPWATIVPDQAALSFVRSWIESIAACD